MVSRPTLHDAHAGTDIIIVPYAATLATFLPSARYPRTQSSFPPPSRSSLARIPGLAIPLRACYAKPGTDIAYDLRAATATARANR
eukprot:3680000-Rhodomonas_salina.2